MRTEPDYPFTPRSTALLRPGQFWSFPLSSGQWACRRVLQLGGEEVPSPSRAFFGGLHNWVGIEPPSSASIAGAGFLAFGVMHIRAITGVSGQVLGIRPLELDAVELPILLSAHGGAGTMVLSGARRLREAHREEWGKLPVLGFWGYDFIQQLAERHLGHVA